MKENVQMSINERLSAMKQIDKKVLTIRRASEELGISLRQTKRIRKRYLEKGKTGLISQKRGMVSNRKIANEIRNNAVKLMTTRYLNFGPTLAS
jgi:hypothetical protein